MKTLLIGLLIAWMGNAAIAANNIIPEEALRALDQAQAATLFSLEPWEEPGRGDKAIDRYKILGKTALNRAQEQAVAALIQELVREWSGAVFGCFDPRQCLRISSGEHTYDFLLCFSCDRLIITKDGTAIASPGMTGSPKFLNQLLSSAKVPLSKTYKEEEHELRLKQRIENDALWLAASPSSIRPFWPAMKNSPVRIDIGPLREPLAREIPEINQRILKLLSWLGYRENAESTLDEYEFVPYDLLFDYPTPEVLSALASITPDERQLQGAALFFGEFRFSKQRPDDLALLSPSLKQQLLDLSLKYGNRGRWPWIQDRLRKSLSGPVHPRPTSPP